MKRAYCAGMTDSTIISKSIVCASDQLESLSYFGHCAHFLFTTCVIYFAYVFFPCNVPLCSNN